MPTPYTRTEAPPAAPGARPRLERPLAGRWLGGVCVGIAEHLGMPVKGMKARHALDTAQHLGPRPRRQLHKAQHGKQHDKQDSLQRTDPDHAESGDHRQQELALVDGPETLQRAQIE